MFFGLAKALADEKITWSGNKHSINLRAEQQLEVAGVESEENLTVRCQSRDQHGFVLRSGQQQRTRGRECILDPAEVLLAFFPLGPRFVAEFTDVAGNLSATICGGHQLPIAFACDLGNQAG